MVIQEPDNEVPLVKSFCWFFTDDEIVEEDGKRYVRRDEHCTMVPPRQNGKLIAGTCTLQTLLLLGPK